MHLNKFRTFGLLAGGIVAGLALTSVQGCDPSTVGDDICGPCGTIAGGSLSISGSAQLDGFFNATGSLNNAVAQIKGSFDADILALADVYGVARGEVNADFVGQLTAAIKADFAANLDGGIKVVYKPAECAVNVSVAVDAQAKCEVQGGCEAQVDPGEVSVKCEGGCSGKCDAACEGDLSCEVTAPSIECSGQCEGSCTLDAAASCDGTCRGDCSGTCSATDSSGKCAGTCDGMCSGSCEFKAAASCAGKCNGKCLVNQGDAQCTGEVSCRGTCMGECKGSCTGKATPPSASASCDASADCQAQASAQASADIQCTPPSIDLQYAFAANVDAEAQGKFLAKIGELKVRGIAILQGFARLGALVTGEVDGKVVFDPSPVVEITGALQGVISAGVEGDLFANVPKGRLLCVIPALQEAVKALGSVATETKGTLEAQASFAAFITTGG